jgi:sulfotransferase family protein
MVDGEREVQERGLILERARTHDLVFVGGTGRSGTHVIARLLGRHSRFEMVPIECRFHCNPSGLADVVTGKATPDEFLDKLRRFWWHRVRHHGPAWARVAPFGRGDAKVRGLHKIIARDRFEEAVAGFEANCYRDPVSASRTLFFDLLGPLAAEAGKPALVEMSCFTVASAAGLTRIFPEARFVHAVRDGRDSGSSKAAKRHKEHHPTGVADGIGWWLERLRLAEEGVRGLGDQGKVVPISLDELVWGDRERAYGDLLGFLELDDEPAMRDFFAAQMSADAAHRERWREGMSEDEQEAVRKRYEAALAQLEADGYQCAPVLRRSYEQGAVSA